MAPDPFSHMVSYGTQDVLGGLSALNQHVSEGKFSYPAMLG